MFRHYDWGMFEAANDDVIMVAGHRAVRICHCCQGRIAVLRRARSRRLAGPEDRGGCAGPKVFFSDTSPCWSCRYPYPFTQLTTNSPTLLTRLTVISFCPIPTGSATCIISIIMCTNMVAIVFVFYNVISFPPVLVSFPPCKKLHST